MVQQKPLWHDAKGFCFDGSGISFSVVSRRLRASWP